MARTVGEERPLPWVAVDDTGRAVARVLADPGRFAGAELVLAGDVRSLAECRALWAEVTGRPPRRVPLPAGLLDRLAGRDLTAMWRWLAAAPLTTDTATLRGLVPDALTVPAWLARRRGRREAPAPG